MFHLARTLPIFAIVLALNLGAATTAPVTAFMQPPGPADSFDAGTLHVDKYGAGARSLILIPGLGCGPWVWFGTIARFQPDYTIYVITLPGFDGRPATDKKPLFATFANDFWAMLAARKIEKPIVIGHSIGGTLAIALAEQQPDRLSAIVAADGLPIFPTLANSTPEQRQAMASRMGTMYATLTPEKELAAEKAYMSRIGTNKPELVDPTAQLETRSDPKAMADWMQEDLANDLCPDLAKITIPFLEVMPYDPPDPNATVSYTQEQTLAFYKSLVAGAPKVTVVAIAPSRHFVMLDQPEAFYKTIEQFLASIHN